MLKQYVFVRDDLRNYNRGQLIAQGIHSSIAALSTYIHHPDTVAYMNGLTNMVTVVLKVSYLF